MSGLVPLGVDLMRQVPTIYKIISSIDLLHDKLEVLGWIKFMAMEKVLLTRLRSEIAQQIESFGGKIHKK